MSVYLDHAATTPMFDVAIDAMNTSLRKLGNPSSLHTEGRSTRKDVEDAREKIAKAVDCLASEIPVNTDGVIDLDFMKKVISERRSEIALISVMHSNNETGVIQPIADVVKIAGDIPVHCDAVQSFTKVPLSFKELGLFAMTISGHKVGGPLGIGALILRRAVEIPALLHGGGQERDIRSGTLNARNFQHYISWNTE